MSGAGRWERLGLVYEAPGTGDMRSHAMLPTPVLLDDRIRVFFAACDELSRGRIYFVDLDRDDPRRIIACDQRPALDLGHPDSFDDRGVNPSQVLVRDGKLLLYYIGWRRISDAVPYTLFAGLAVSEDQGVTFRRQGTGQILHPASDERYFRTAPFVFRQAHAWGMLYIGGGTFFDGGNSKRLPRYSLCRTHSQDGYRWTEAPSLPLLLPDEARGEIGFGRPILWHEQGQASLMISVRTERGYTLRNIVDDAGGLRWTDVLPGVVEDWEASMICFGAPCVVDDWEYLFYNGNQFGRSGFGLARRVAQVKPALGAAATLLDALGGLNES